MPYAKDRLGVDDGMLGVLLLCVDAGSVIIMPITGGLVARLGSRSVILASGLGFCAALPVMATTSSTLAIAAALLLFGASLGAMDVAMNIHAVEVERGSPRPLMSGFHALFSVGGIAGAGGMTALLAAGVSLGAASLVGGLVIVLVLIVAAPRYLETRVGRGAPFFVRPRGMVLLLGALAFVSFLVEGAVLDWSALVMTRHQGFPAAQGGLAYAVFSVTMTIGRLTGDGVVARLGSQRVLVLSGLLTIAGLIAILPPELPWLALGGFAVIGIGAANIVPLLFSAAGRQTVMPSGLAIAGMTTIAYSGILTGPAAIGFLAEASDLPTALGMVAVLTLLIPLCARMVTKDG